MGCVCCSLSSFVSILLDALERISLCTVCAMLTCCLLFTLIAMMVMGIGIGFHYCFVQNSVDAMAKAAKAAGAVRSGGGGGGGSGVGSHLREAEKAVRRKFAQRRAGRARRGMETPLASNNSIDSDLLYESGMDNNTFYHNVSEIIYHNISAPYLNIAANNFTNFTIV